MARLRVTSRASRRLLRLPLWLRRELSGRVSGGLVVGWIALSLATLATSEGAPMQFLDLPLGAYLAIQGAFLGLVLIGVSLLRPH